jgi:hypothetical protein
MVRGFLGAIQSVIVFAGTALPWLAGLGLIALGVKYLWRSARGLVSRIRNRRKS